MKRNIIWCEVSCRHCGGLAFSSGYYSPALIKRLKEETKDWIDNEYYGVLCPDCQKKLNIK